MHSPHNHLTNEHNPYGFIDAVEQVEPGKIRVAGWVYDKDDENRSLDIHVYVGGRANNPAAEFHGAVANRHRPDLGHNWGYDIVLDTHKVNSQEVCVYGINIGGGKNSELGCREVRIFEPNPEGGLHSLEATGGAVSVRGYAWDNSNREAGVPIHVYLGGEAGNPGAEFFNVGLADKPDEHTSRLGIVGNHGFDATVTTNRVGPTKVCAYALSIGHGYGNPLLGCREVDIPAPKVVGGFDVVESPAPGKVSVRGWAHDQSDRQQPAKAHVWIGGKKDASGARGPFELTANKPAPSGVNDLFEATLNSSVTGATSVCVYANSNAHPDMEFLGCRDADTCSAQSAEAEQACAFAEAVCEADYPGKAEVCSDEC